MAALVAVLAVQHGFVWMVVLTLLLFIPVPTVAVAGQPYLLGLIPDGVRGRVLTAAGLVPLVVSAGAQALTGFVLDSGGFAALAWGVAVILLLASAVGGLSAVVRNIPMPGTEEPDVTSPATPAA